MIAASTILTQELANLQTAAFSIRLLVMGYRFNAMVVVGMILIRWLWLLAMITFYRVMTNAKSLK